MFDVFVAQIAGHKVLLDQLLAKQKSFNDGKILCVLIFTQRILCIVVEVGIEKIFRKALVTLTKVYHFGYIGFMCFSHQQMEPIFTTFWLCPLSEPLPFL